MIEKSQVQTFSKAMDCRKGTLCRIMSAKKGKENFFNNPTRKGAANILDGFINGLISALTAAKES